MTLEEINDIEDKEERLMLLKKYIEEDLQFQRLADEFHFPHDEVVKPAPLGTTPNSDASTAQHPYQDSKGVDYEAD